MNRIEIVDVAVQLIRALQPIIRKIRLHDMDEVKQMRSASASIVRNASEGWERSGRDKTNHYRMAAGSAREVRGGLLIAEASGWIDAAEMAGPMELCDRALAMLWRMTH